MTGHLIDLTKIDFWIVSLLAVAVLAPLTRAMPRRWATFALNMGFLALLLHEQAAWILGTLVATHLLLIAIDRRRFSAIATSLAGLSLLALFILHKLAQFGDRVGLGQVNPILSVVGFSYVALRMVEVLRAVIERRHRHPDFISLCNYLVPFHMLAAGPIQAYDEFVAQPAEPAPLSPRDVLSASERIAFGLFKKFVLAYAIRKLFLTDFQADGVYWLLEIQFFFMWLFLDFSAYSDISVGIGRLIGVATPENFNRPYLARNVIDFWERWHISLSMFIRRNVFIPIQLFLVRRNDGRTALLSASVAFMVAFLLCGLWHGLSARFLIWGALHASGLVVTNLYRHFLKGRWNPERIRGYMANGTIRLAAQVLTYEFVALSFLPLYYP